MRIKTLQQCHIEAKVGCCHMKELRAAHIPFLLQLRTGDEEHLLLACWDSPKALSVYRPHRGIR